MTVKKFFFGRFGTYTIDDLNTPSQQLKYNDRKFYKIAVVDDESFIHLENLKRLGFDIHHYNDVVTLDMLSSYHIIICDIKGVGQKFDSEFEGAFLISELKKKYPFKIFAAYTGSAFDLRINNYLDGVQIIKKDYGIGEWASAIDALIKEVGDPKTVWKKLRNDLLDKNVPLNVLVKLEDEFVDIVLNKNCDFTNFPSNRKNLDLDVIDKIVNVVVKGVIFLSNS